MGDDVAAAPNEIPGRESTFKPRKRWLAVLLSFLGSGVGHLYCGRVDKAIAFILLNLCTTAGFTYMPAVPYSPVLLVVLFAVGVLVIGTAMVDAWRTAGSAKPYALKPVNRWYVYLFGLMLVWGGNSIMQLSSSFETFYVASRSMEPTLHVDEFFIVARHRFDGTVPARGKIVLFKHPKTSRGDSVKRVVGLPGETLQWKQGRLYIDESEVDRRDQGTASLTDRDDRVYDARVFIETLPDTTSYWVAESDPAAPKGDSKSITVPEGHVFVLGDNRNASLDSRFSEVGTVPVESIFGVATFIYWSDDTGRIGLKVR